MRQSFGCQINCMAGEPRPPPPPPRPPTESCRTSVSVYDVLSLGASCIDMYVDVWHKTPSSEAWGDNRWEAIPGPNGIGFYLKSVWCRATSTSTTNLGVARWLAPASGSDTPCQYVQPQLVIKDTPEDWMLWEFVRWEVGSRCRWGWVCGCSAGIGWGGCCSVFILTHHQHPSHLCSLAVSLAEPSLLLIHCPLQFRTSTSAASPRDSAASAPAAAPHPTHCCGVGRNMPRHQQWQAVPVWR